MKNLPEKGAGYRDLIAGTSHIAIDLETLTVPKTDDESAHQRMIAMGVVLLLNGERRGEWHWLSNPGHPVDAESSAYNGIATDDIKDAPTPATVLAELDKVLTQYPDAVVVCHNASFDIGVLRREYELADMEMFDRPVFDTMRAGARLKVPEIASQAKLLDLVVRYGLKNSIKGKAGRTQKGLQDARDCADVLTWLYAEAAARGIDTSDRLEHTVVLQPASEVTAIQPRSRRRSDGPDIPSDHYRDVHSNRLPVTGCSLDRIKEWMTEIDECVELRCSFIREKTQIETQHTRRVMPLFLERIPDCTEPGMAGTLLYGLEPFIAIRSRNGARTWWRDHHEAIKQTAACTAESPCPTCAVGQPCTRDMLYRTVAKAAVDYSPKSITCESAYENLFRQSDPVRGVRLWTQQGMTDLAGYVTLLAIRQYREDRNTRRALEITDLATSLGLHEAEPELALEIALIWERERKFRQIDRLVAKVVAHADTNPAYFELDTWYEVSHRPGRAKSVKKATARKGPLKRKPSPVELRPPDRVHDYKYRVYD